MSLQYSDFIFISLGSTVFSLGIALYSLGKNNVRNTQSFSLLMLSIGIWCFASTMELISRLPEQKIFWSQFSYLGIATIGPAWLGFSLNFTALKNRLTRSILNITLIISCLLIISAFTNDYHRLIWKQATPYTNEFGLFIHYSHGPLVIFNSFYTYLLFLSGFILVVIAAFQNPADYKWNAILFGIAGLIPVLTNVLYMVSKSDLFSFDLTPVSFAATGLILFIGLFRFHFLSILPMAHQALFENMKDAVIIMDNNQRIKAVNPAFYKLIESDFIKVRSIEKTFPEFIPEFIQEVKTLVTNGRTEAETELRLPDKDIKYLHLLISIIDEGKKKRDFLIVIRDITQRKLTELALSASKAKTEEFANTQNKLLSIISHDLKNSIGGISNAIEYLLLDHELDEETKREVLNELNNNSKMTVSLLENILEWAKVKNVNLFNPTWYNCRTLIVKVIDLMNYQALVKKISIETIIDPELKIYTDTQIFAAIMRNLLSNAIKFSPISGKIILKAKGEKSHIQIEVIDNGTGMSEAILTNVFDFKEKQTSLGTKNEKGSGFGLFMVKEFMELHNGIIVIDSKPGKGTRVILQFPVPADS